MTEINVTKIKQAGDNFFGEAMCPNCQDIQFFVFPWRHCTMCRHEVENYQYDFSGAERHLLCGTKRKKISKSNIRKLLAQQGFQCAYCFIPLGELGENIRIDHIFAVSLGGSNIFDNLAASCHPCNSTAGAKYFQNIESKREFILKKRGMKE